MAVLAPVSSSNMEWPSTLPIQQLTMTLYIPTSSVGAIIGRRGSTIAQIQRQAQTLSTESNVRVSIVGHQQQKTPQQSSQSVIDVEDDVVATPLSDEGGPAVASTSSSVIPYTYTELDWSSPNWTPVVVKADPAAALFVGQQFESMTSLQDVIMDLPIGRSKHSLIVGKRGLTIMNLSASTQVRIMVPPREFKHDLIQLEGPLENCIACLEELAKIIPMDDELDNVPNNSNATSGKPATPSKPPASSNDSHHHHHHHHQNFDHQQSMVIQQLPSQTKLRSIGRKTETIVKKKKHEEAWQLTIMGHSTEQVAAAVSILQKWNDNAKMPSRKGGSGSGGRGGGRGSKNNNKRGGRGFPRKNSE
jgi:predicted RNA-binding protein YlqC (UPF0109 family)